MNVKRREYMFGVLSKRRILMWRVAEEPGHDGVHHDTRPQQKAWSRPFVPASTSIA